MGDVRSFLCLEGHRFYRLSQRGTCQFIVSVKKKKDPIVSKSSGKRPSLAGMTWKSGHLSGFGSPEGTFVNLVVVLLQRSREWGATLGWQRHCPSPKITMAEGTDCSPAVQTWTDQTTTRHSKCRDAHVIYIPKTLYCVYLNIIYHVHIPKVLRSILHG